MEGIHEIRKVEWGTWYKNLFDFKKKYPKALNIKTWTRCKISTIGENAFNNNFIIIIAIIVELDQRKAILNW